MDRNFKYLIDKYGEEGARYKFENFIARALQKKYKDAYQVKASQGDGGIDVFRGDLRNPIIYQCKFFVNSLGSTQKQNIKESYKTALKNYPLFINWILCIPKLLTQDEHKWWNGFKKDNPKTDLMDENMLISLLKETNVYEEIFELRIDSGFYKKSYEVQYKKALNHIENEEYQEALEVLKSLESECEDSQIKDILYNMGHSYLMMALLPTAEKKETLLIKASNYLKKSMKLLNDEIEEIDIDIYVNLTRVYLELAEYKDKEKNYNSALEVIKLAIESSKNIEKYEIDYLRFLLDLAMIYENLFDVSILQEGKLYLYKSIEIYKSICDKNEYFSEELAFRTYHNYGRCLEKKSEIDYDVEHLNDALKCYLESSKLPNARVESDPKQFAMIHNNIGNVYMKKCNFCKSEGEIKDVLKEALKSYSLALEVYTPHFLREEYTKTKTNLGNIYRMLYKNSGEDKYFFESKKCFDEAASYRTLSSEPVGYGKIQIGLALLYKFKGDFNNEASLYEKSIERFDKALYVFTKEKYQKYYCKTKQEIGTVYLALANQSGNKDLYEKSLNNFKEVLSMFAPNDNMTLFRVTFDDAEKAMWTIFESIQDIDKKIKWYEAQLEFIKSINAEGFAFSIYYNLCIALRNRYTEKGNFEDIIAAVKLVGEYLEHGNQVMDNKESISEIYQLQKELKLLM